MMTMISGMWWWWMYQPMMATTFTAEQVAAVIVALLGAGGLGIFGGKKMAERRVSIEGQPLTMQMQEDFVTRREFDKLEAIVAVNATRTDQQIKAAVDKMDGYFDRLTKMLADQSKMLSAELGRVAKGAYEGRQRLHAKVNEQGEELAAVKEKVGSAKELLEVGREIADALR